MKAKLLFLSVSLALMAAWLGKFFPNSWPDGHY
jgi:hypothetical protein